MKRLSSSKNCTTIVQIHLYTVIYSHLHDKSQKAQSQVQLAAYNTMATCRIVSESFHINC